jgi:hypothetical protein
VKAAAKCRRSRQCHAQGSDDGRADALAGRDMRDVIPAGARSARGHLLAHDDADAGAYWLGYVRAYEGVLSALAEDAANILEWRGYLGPDEDEIPAEVAAGLAEMAREGTCRLCLAPVLTADALADHYLGRKQEEYERSLPVWTCGCGAAYKKVATWGSNEDLYQAVDGSVHGPLCAEAEPPGLADCPHRSCASILFGGGSLLGDRAGEIRRNAKGQVTQSGACPACGTPFAVVTAARASRKASAQQTLF